MKNLHAHQTFDDDDIAANGTFNAFAVNLPPPRRSEIYFEYDNETDVNNVTVIGVVGRKTLLKCKVQNLGNKTVNLAFILYYILYTRIFYIIFLSEHRYLGSGIEICIF